MTKKVSLPTVLLVGRTNVGKSTLFNRLIDDKKSIVYEQEGVTRDYLHETMTWDGKTFDLIDTGGFSLARGKDEITSLVEQRVRQQLTICNVIVFVCDGKNGMIEHDRLIARELHKLKKPVLLVINKADNRNAFSENIHEFQALGFKTIIPVSALHGSGIRDLLDTVVAQLPARAQTQYLSAKPEYKVVILGKPNVGKSSLTNLLMRQDRAIVSDIAGTTREAISEMIYHAQDLFELTDTPGVRKQKKVRDDELEGMMVKSALRAVRDADVVILMIDTTQGTVSDQELKLLFYAYEQKKMVMVLFNKTDILDDYNKSTLLSTLDEYEFIFRRIPQLWISCMSKKNVSRIYGELAKMRERCTQNFNSIQVDELIKAALGRHPLMHNKMKLRVHKVKAIPSHIPTFDMKVNFPEWFGESEIACLENILRKNFDLKGCPISITVHT
ncbi:MAG: ribosome biogenesis GTPase Der [Epsilonproteobacteria bacterium]|nr:ribosome biogenesis GTPase Der [Campylobacterota bacterium]